ncbi:hypothetical protein F7725_011448 [Dissostichus mawsoni]|uniref:MHC class I-like antigen recognition-like domain-containing protein n=1 Tax=Dissostichus mawsoni TaxID=36200 RepID=A0A7J5ZC39_DISMA|nr:hypothetical protein F7725_011448 [Dissostichus mawsoni]
MSLPNSLTRMRLEPSSSMSRPVRWSRLIGVHVAIDTLPLGLIITRLFRLTLSVHCDREAMFPVNTPDNRSTNQEKAHSATRHQGALLPHTEIITPSSCRSSSGEWWGLSRSQSKSFSMESLKDKSQEVDSIIQTMSVDALLPTLINVNQTSILSNHTVLRSRECILEGSQLLWADRVFYDGKVYLTLDHTDTWTAHVPEALAFKVLWEKEEQRTKIESTRLQEECVKLMKELMLSQEQSGIPLPQVLVPILAVLVFTGLIMITILLSKKQGLRHPGGVVGSIIHYPKDIGETAPEIKGNGYRTL